MASPAHNDEYCREERQEWVMSCGEKSQPRAFNLQGGQDHAIVEDLPSN